MPRRRRGNGICPFLCKLELEQRKIEIEKFKLDVEKNKEELKGIRLKNELLEMELLERRGKFKVVAPN